MATLGAVIFDVDGILIRSEDHHFQSWAGALGEYGMVLDRSFFDDHLLGLGRDAALHRILQHSNCRFGTTAQKCILDDKNSRFLELVARTPPPLVPGAFSLVVVLKSHGLWIAAASSSRNARALLQGSGILSLIDVVIDGQEAPSKPDPAIFRQAAQRLGVPPASCIVIEDAPAGIEAARSARMSVVGVGPAERFQEGLLTVSDLSHITLEWLTTCHARQINS